MSENVIFNESFMDKILKIELNNLSKKNALSLEMITEMASKLSQDNYIRKFKRLYWINSAYYKFNYRKLR